MKNMSIMIIMLVFYSFSIGVVNSVNKIVGVSNIPNDQQFELILVDQLSDLNFYVGSIHYGWVLEEEASSGEAAIRRVAPSRATCSGDGERGGPATSPGVQST